MTLEAEQRAVDIAPFAHRKRARDGVRVERVDVGRVEVGEGEGAARR